MNSTTKEKESFLLEHNEAIVSIRLSPEHAPKTLVKFIFYDRCLTIICDMSTTR